MTGINRPNTKSEDNEVVSLHHAVEYGTDEEIKHILSSKDIKVNGLVNGVSALHVAVRNNRVEVIKFLKEKGANFNIKEKRLGQTPLHLAIKEKNLEIAKILLDGGSNPNALTKHCSTALHMGLQDESMVKLLLEYGANVDTKKFGKNSLHLATELSNTAVIRMLLERTDKVDDVSIDGQTPLHIAIEMKNLEISRLLLAKGARTDIKKFGRCPIYLSVRNGCLEITKEILRSQRDIAPVYQNRCIALGLAFENNDKETVETFFQMGVDPNSPVGDKKPLHLAIERNWMDIVQLLRAKGADINAVTSNYHESGLHIALEKRNEEAVTLLLEWGAETNVQHRHTGITPLYISVKNLCLTTCQMLLARGADPNIASNLNVTPLHLAFEARNQELVLELLRHGADPNVPKSGKTPLQLCVECQWLGLARYLLEGGARPDVPGVGPSALSIALLQSNVEMTKLLLNHGANVNQPDVKSQLTPLQQAISKRCDEATDLLIQHGADINYTCKDGTCALQLALDKRNETIVRKLLHMGVGLQVRRKTLTPLHVAAEHRWHEIARILLDRGADPNQMSMYWMTPLMLSAERCDIQMARLLLSRGAKVQHHKFSNSPLYIAAVTKCTPMVELMLDHGADINELSTMDTDMQSALHVALRNQDEPTAHLLIRRKANVNLRERKQNRKPLHLAAEAGLLEAARMIIARRADPDPRDRFDITPLQLSVMRNHPRLVELLLEHGANVNSFNFSDSFSCLHYAIMGHNYNMAELLLREGADMHAAKPTSESPFSLAARNVNDLRMIQLLLDYDLEHYAADEHAAKLEEHISNSPADLGISKAILKHLARRGVELTQDAANERRVGSRLRNFYQACTVEIEKLKETPVYEGIDFFTLLNKPSKELVPIVRNESFQTAFEGSGYQTAFPLYQDILKASVARAMVMSRVLDGAQNIFTLFFRMELPDQLNRRILGYLRNTDLRVLSHMNKQYLAMSGNKSS